MTEERLPLAELLAKSDDGDFLRSVAEAVLQLLMEADVEGLIGAARHERTAERQTYRNGYRDRALDTRLGTLQLRIPKLRAGPSYFPPFLEPRGVDPTRRRPGPGHGPVGHQQEPGQQAVQGHRRAGERLPRPPARGRVAVPVARRDVPAAARGRP